METPRDVDSKQCIDYAAGKVAFELCNHPQYMTAEGDELVYGTNIEKYGYLGIHHPANITLDLAQSGEIVDVRQISIKFMDANDSLNLTPMKGQEYAFRLLCSEDGRMWRVLYDSTNTDTPYRVGWSHFIFRDSEALEVANSGAQRMRYFRVHALHNPVSSGFHVVRLRLFGAEKSMPHGDTIILQSNGAYDTEINDTTPLATKLLNIAERLYSSTPDVYKLSPKTEVERDASSVVDFNAVYNHVVEKAFELQAVDGKVDQVRKIVAPLISRKMEEKMVDGVKSMRREWMIMISLLALYIVVKLLVVFNKI